MTKDSGPGMAAMLSKMPGMMRKMMMSRKIDAISKMTPTQRTENIRQMLAQVAQLDEKGRERMLETRSDIASDLKNGNSAKAKTVTQMFQNAFEKLDQKKKNELKKSMKTIVGTNLPNGKEWVQFDL